MKRGGRIGSGGIQKRALKVGGENAGWRGDSDKLIPGAATSSNSLKVNRKRKGKRRRAINRRGRSFMGNSRESGRQTGNQPIRTYKRKMNRGRKKKLYGNPLLEGRGKNVRRSKRPFWDAGERRTERSSREGRGTILARRQSPVCERRGEKRKMKGN